MSRVFLLRRPAGLAMLLAWVLVGVLATTPALTAEGRPLDLNTATSEQLQSLPGIGPAIAQRIVEYREKNGPFRRTTELMNVKGIGEKTFERLKSLITVGPEKSK